MVVRPLVLRPLNRGKTNAGLPSDDANGTSTSSSGMSWWTELTLLRASSCDYDESENINRSFKRAPGSGKPRTNQVTNEIPQLLGPFDGTPGSPMHQIERVRYFQELDQSFKRGLESQSPCIDRVPYKTQELSQSVKGPLEFERAPSIHVPDEIEELIRPVNGTPGSQRPRINHVPHDVQVLGPSFDGGPGSRRPRIDHVPYKIPELSPSGNGPLVFERPIFNNVPYKTPELSQYVGGPLDFEGARINHVHEYDCCRPPNILSIIKNPLAYQNIHDILNLRLEEKEKEENESLVWNEVKKRFDADMSRMHISLGRQRTSYHKSTSRMVYLMQRWAYGRSLEVHVEMEIKKIMASEWHPVASANLARLKEYYALFRLEHDGRLPSTVKDLKAMAIEYVGFTSTLHQYLAVRVGDILVNAQKAEQLQGGDILFHLDVHQICLFHQAMQQVEAQTGLALDQVPNDHQFAAIEEMTHIYLYRRNYLNYNYHGTLPYPDGLPYEPTNTPDGPFIGDAFFNVETWNAFGARNNVPVKSTFSIRHLWYDKLTWACNRRLSGGSRYSYH